MWVIGLAGAGLAGAGCVGEITSGAPDWAEFDDIEVELPDGSLLPAELVYFDNDRGESLFGVYAAPDGPGPRPVVVILHGAGGLFSTPDSNDTVFEVPDSFAEWIKFLTDRGYAVLLPDSFVSRGYLEQHESTPERLITRVYDAYGALDYACGRPDIDCARAGVIGFSNGASAATLMVHEGIGDVPGMEELRAERPRLEFSCAYYPGCGFTGLVSSSLDDPAEFYVPGAPVWIHHGQDDSLLDGCQERVTQVDRLVELGQLAENPMTLWVYDAGHGFDSSPGSAQELEARDEARTRTLDIVTTLL